MVFNLLLPPGGFGVEVHSAQFNIHCTELLGDIGVGVIAAHQGSVSCSLGCCVQLHIAPLHCTDKMFVCTAPVRCTFAVHQCKVSLIFQSLHNFHLRPDQKAIIMLMTTKTIMKMKIYKLI